MDVCVDGESEERSSTEAQHSSSKEAQDSSSPLNLRGGFSESSTARFGMQGMQATSTRLPTPPGGGGQRMTPAGAPRQVAAVRQVVRVRGRRLTCFQRPSPQASPRLDASQDPCLRRPTVALSLVHSTQRQCVPGCRWLRQRQCLVGSRSRCLGRPSHALSLLHTLSLLHSSTRSTASLLQMAAGDGGGRAGGGVEGVTGGHHPIQPLPHTIVATYLVW